MDEHTRRLLSALDAEGVLLQHDKALPSASGVVAAEPVSGSWWAHPMAHEIYGALQAIEAGGFARRCPLVAGKLTLVARRLWPELLAVVTERTAWQTSALTAASQRLLELVDDDPEPRLVDRSTRLAANQLESRLLVHATEVHLSSGRHTKALQGWDALGVTASPSAAAARETFDSIVSAWGATKRLLPWPPG